MLRLLAILIGLVALAPARAAERHYDIRISLEPATRLLEARVRATLPEAGRFALGFAPQALTIDGRAVDPAAPSWPLAAGHAEIAVRATLPSLEAARASRVLMPFADADGSFLPLVDSGDADGAFTYEVTIDVPAGQRAVAPGRLTEEREADGRAVARFVFDQPARELSVFAGPYVVGETIHAGRRLRTYFPAGLDQLGERYRRQVARYLDDFSARIGPYPHSEFHVVASPLPVGLGFPTLTYVSRQILPLPFMQERSLAHEVLHAWWGHGVLVDYAHGNWSEALTTVMADYALAEAEGEDAARDMRRRWLADFAVLTPAQERPLAVFVARHHTASQVIGYNKGAMLFLMLRDEIGAAFDAGIRRFWREQRFRVAGWSELRAAFEAEAGRPLDAFFRQWLDRPGAPQLTLRDVARRPDGVAFTLAQSSPPYRLAVPVVIETAAGTERHVVRLDTEQQSYELRPAARATALRIDPDGRLLRKLPLAEVPAIIRSLIAAPNAATVIADDDPDVVEAGHAVAAAVLEAGARVSPLDQARAAKAPLLLVGTTPRIAATLARMGVERPNRLGGRGTATVWAARDGDVPLLVVEGRDADALRQCAGAIRHYGASSWLVFDGGKVIERGVLPPAARPLEAALKD